MRSDRMRTIGTIVAYAITVIINGAAVAIPLGGETTGQISDRFPVPIVPANYVFSIWSTIYTLLLAFTIWQALPGRRREPVLRRLGWLPAISGILNTAWVLVWQLQVFAPTVPIMVALLLVLIEIWRRIRAPQAEPVSRSQGWCVAMPFSVYLGWITVATIANVTQMLWLFLGKPDDIVLGGPVWGAAILLVGLAIASPIVHRARDVAYGIVIVWAYMGIVAKQTTADPVPLATVVVAAAGAAWIALLCLDVIRRTYLPSRGAGAGGTAAAA